MKSLAAVVTVIGVVIAALALSGISQSRPSDLTKGSLFVTKDLPVLPLDETSIKAAGADGFLFNYRGDTSLRYLSFDGTRTYVYKLGQMPMEELGAAMTYWDYTSDGSTVYILTNSTSVLGEDKIWRTKCHVGRYDLNGNYRDTVDLDGTYNNCLKMTTLGNGQLIIGGEAVDTLAPYTAVFKTNGQIVKMLELPNDIEVVGKKGEGKELRSLQFVHPGQADLMLTMSRFDHDASGNVLIMRMEEPGPTGHRQIPVAFVLSPDGSVHRIEMPKASTKRGSLQVARIFNQQVVGLYLESNDMSEHFHGTIRVYSIDGKLQHELNYEPYDFGSVLLDWNSHRGLFATQAGTSRNERRFAMIEALY